MSVSVQNILDLLHIISVPLLERQHIVVLLTLHLDQFSVVVSRINHILVLLLPAARCRAAHLTGLRSPLETTDN